LGELRGKLEWFASGVAKQERAAGALPGSLTRIGTAEGWAERAYRGSLEAQRAADATGIPHLSPVVEAALGAVAAAGSEQVRGEAWRGGRCRRTSRLRLSWRGSGRRGCAPRCGPGRAGAVTSASVAPEQRPALDRVAQTTATSKWGERAGAGLAQREAGREHQGQYRGLRM